MIVNHKEKGGLGVLHLIKVEDPSSFGCVVHDESGRISQFIEKPPKGTEPTNEINAGTYLLDPKVLDFIPPGRKVSIERETFPKVLADGQPLYAHTTDDYWIDVGRPEHYLTVHRDVLSGLMPLEIEPGISGPGAANADCANLVAPVHIGEGSIIARDARVGPNVVLGKNCRIAAGAAIEDSVLWDEVVVEEGATIEETIIASRSTIGANAKIGKGSVIGHDARVEPGTVAPEGSRIGPSAPIGAR
jgi:NDP-sugar pyrophosphorylase family protein